MKSSESILTPIIQGLTATVPFTAIMLGMKVVYPAHGRRPVPPKQITEQIVDATLDGENLSESGLNVLSTLTHFAFGGVVGGLFSPISKRLPGSPAILGIGYGFTVWAASYGGWLQAFDLQPKLENQPRGRNTVMILSHLVWGMTLGLMESTNRRHR